MPPDKRTVKCCTVTVKFVLQDNDHSTSTPITANCSARIQFNPGYFTPFYDGNANGVATILIHASDGSIGLEAQCTDTNVGPFTLLQGYPTGITNDTLLTILVEKCKR